MTKAILHLPLGVIVLLTIGPLSAQARTYPYKVLQSCTAGPADPVSPEGSLARTLY